MGFADLSSTIIGFGIAVHRELGPGLLESAYARCLAHECTLAGIPHRLEHPMQVQYRGIDLGSAYRIDLLVDDQLVVEIKCVEAIHPRHEAQLLTYMKLAGVRTGLLLNFHAALLKDGIKRMVL